MRIRHSNLPGWSYFVIAFAVAIGAAILIIVVTKRNDDARKAQIALTKIEERSQHINSLGWESIAVASRGQPLPAAFSEAINSEDQDVLANLAILDDIAAGEERLDELKQMRNLYGAFKSTADKEVALLEAGNVAEAAAVQEKQVEPGYASLEDLIGVLDADYSEGAHESLILAYAGSASTAVAAALIIGFLFWRFERQRIEMALAETEKKALRSRSIIDELTGLYNRRGFHTLAEQQLRNAQRSRSDAQLLFIDLDDMKWINDKFGHAAGDEALADLAAAFRQTFRESDIIGRFGGDEFVVLALDTPAEKVQTLIGRLFEHVDARNSRKPQFRLSFSIGRASCEAPEACSIDELIERADRAMYQQKKGKKGEG